MAHPSKRKGSNFELECVKILQEHGVGAVKVPLSGSVGGSFSGDIDCPVRGVDRKIECKRRKRQFGTLYSFLEGAYAVCVRDDKTEPLVLMRLKDWAELAK